MPTKTCEHCGNAYQIPPSKANSSRFCSQACRLFGHERITKTCEYCGKEYVEFKAYAERSRFCSAKCRNLGVGHQQTVNATETRTCPVCEATFQTTNHHGGRKTCSLRCANVLRGASSKGRDGKVDRVCKECGNTFRVFPSRTTVYCSRACNHAGHMKAITGRFRSSSVVKCAHCGKPIRRPNSRLTIHRHQFCDKHCYHAWDLVYKGSDPMRFLSAQRIAQRIADGVFASQSQVEGVVADWLAAHNILFEQQVLLGSFRVADFKAGDTYIEVNGCYWHGCPTHFPDPEPRQLRRQSRDAGMQTYCRERGLALLVIWEHDVRSGDFSSLASLLGDN